MEEGGAGEEEATGLGGGDGKVERRVQGGGEVSREGGGRHERGGSWKAGEVGRSLGVSWKVFGGGRMLGGGSQKWRNWQTRWS